MIYVWAIVLLVVGLVLVKPARNRLKKRIQRRPSKQRLVKFFAGVVTFVGIVLLVMGALTLAHAIVDSTSTAPPSGVTPTDAPSSSPAAFTHPESRNLWGHCHKLSAEQQRVWRHGVCLE